MYPFWPTVEGEVGNYFSLKCFLFDLFHSGLKNCPARPHLGGYSYIIAKCAFVIIVTSPFSKRKR